MADVHYTDPSRQSELPEDLDQEAAASEYVSNLQPIKDGRRKQKRNRIIMIVLVVLAALAAAGYFLFLKPEPVEQPAPQTNQPQQTEPQPQTVETETYRSVEMSLSFDYPNNWTIEDATTGLIKVESPIVKLADSAGTQTDAKVVVTFLTSGSEVPAYGEASAEAAQDSEKIAYTNPSQSQRAETYLSFASFGGQALDAVFVTGDNGYQKGQLIPESDIKKGDPIISVVFYSCNGTECAGEGLGQFQVGLDDWTANPTLVAVQNLLKSLRAE